MLARFRVWSECVSEVWGYLREHGITPVEGSATRPQVEHLMSLASDSSVRLVGEIGFHVGVSCEGFLRANPAATVISFDLGAYEYVFEAKKFIDERFPGRHLLIFGDSKETVPQFAQQNPATRFDLVFVDGGHEYETAKADLVNLRLLCHERTVVVMDDLLPWLHFGVGPTRAWTEALREGLLTQETLLKDGSVVERVEPPADRAWAVGRYLF
jgi:Methyltransferase domain